MKVWRLIACIGVVAGCAAQPLPDPDVALQRLREAIERGDAEAVHALLDQDARAQLSVADVKRLLQQSRPELTRRAKSFGAAASKAEAQAEVTYADGEVAVLRYEQGRFFVSAAGGLLGWGSTPARALGELRRALQRRSYSALSAVLSADSKSKLEQEMSGLIDGLERPEALEIDVDGDRAVVTTPTGHVVQLQREDGVWKVRDFD